MKTQILLIHGGMTFKNRKDYIKYLKTRDIYIDGKKYWSDEYLKKALGRGFQIIKPRMPLSDNAIYEDWKIYFERYLPYLRNNVILVGNSLGGIFLAKYLSENRFPKRILATYLVSAPYDNALSGEDLVGGFRLRSNLSRIMKNSKNTTFLFSRHDDVVPVSHAEKYRRKLKDAKIIIYNHIKGHFKISKFPEIVKMIKDDVLRKR